MANTTPNIGLVQPVDGAAQWGSSLNDNFGIIDSKIKDSIEIATTQFISAGLYKSPQTETGFITSDTTITTESLKCFFPALITDTSLSVPDTLPGTANYTLSLNVSSFIVEAGKAYQNFFIGLRVSNTAQIEPYVTTDASTFSISNGNDIYLGSVVVLKDGNSSKFVSDLAIFKPWFCNFSSNNRGIDIANHGILTNGKIDFIENNKKSLRPVEQFSWQHEGINFTNEAMPHYRESLVEVNSDNKIEFFHAYDNAIVSDDELKIWTELDGSKWWNEEAEEEKARPVTSNYYTIQRYCILENGKSVVFYGKQEFATKDEALSQLPFLQPLNVMVICKEVARIIVQNSDNPDNIIINLMSSENTSNYGFFNDTQFTIYNDEEGSIKFKAQDNQNIYLIPDALKKEYVIGDAAENRSNGILPTSNTFTLNVEDGSLSINGIKGAFVNNGINNASKIDYFTIGSGIYPLEIPSPATEGWYSLVINKNASESNPFSINHVQKLYENAILIGYLYFDGGSYVKAIFTPYMLLTSPSARLNYLYSKISVNGCYGDVNGSNLNIHSGIMNIEGVNYQSLTNTNIKEQMQGQVNWTYINKDGLIRDDRSDTNVLDKRYYYNDQGIKTQVTQDYYTVQKVLLAADGTWFVSYGTNQYNSYNAAKEHLVDEININNNMMLEIMSLILKNGTQDENTEPIVYYTNKKFLGNIQISTVDASDVVPHYPTSGENGFYLYKLGNDTQRLTYVWDTSNNNPVAINIYKNGFGIAEKFIETPTSTEDNKCIVYDSTNNEFTYATMVTPSQLTALADRVSELENLINGSNFVTYTTTAPNEPAIGQMVYTQISNSNQYEVKFWNGTKWEKLNTWQ